MLDTPDQPTLAPEPARNPIAVLRQFARARPPAERCELCAAPLSPEHQHLLDPAARQLLCACDACAVLFSAGQGMKYRRVPRRIESWPGLVMSNDQWDALGIPIGLAFFFRNSAGQTFSVYPSPAGATEVLLAQDVWQMLVADNPALEKLEADVEALLVNRIRGARQYFRLPIDECYKLVGLIRTHWRGLSGGKEMWEQITEFFQSLEARSVKVRTHA
ncbi:MAG: hypothetical protein JWN24_1869 [Phycisphaerales bacterium]|nr:hypothetical protein [Phycisphaerales bacterium]